MNGESSKQGDEASPDVTLVVPQPEADATKAAEPVVAAAGSDAQLTQHPQLATLAKARNYEIGKRHARGGMGEVLFAKDLNIHRTVAMKVMLGDGTATADQVMRFVDEAQITGQLEHPNIVPIYELGLNAAQRPFYTMKFVRGLTLKKVLEDLAAGEQGTLAKFPLVQLLTIFQKVCDAVAFAHSRGVIHRDLKPENVMLGDFGEVLVMDWGLAKSLAKNGEPEAKTSKPARATDTVESSRTDSDEFATQYGTVLGSPQFMSPEQASGKVDELDERTDIYSLGAILYNLLTLSAPIKKGTLDEMLECVRTGKIESPSAIKTELAHCPGGRIPESLSAVSMKAMSLSPDARYPTVPDLQKEIAAFQLGFATVAERAGPAKRAMLFLRRHRKAVVPIAALTLIFGAWFSIYLATQHAARVKRHAALVETAQRAKENKRWDDAIEAFAKAGELLNRSEDFDQLTDTLVQGARRDLDERGWGAAAIKLQRALTIRPGHQDAQSLMPFALGEGFLSVTAAGGGELTEFFVDQNFQPVLDSKTGQRKQQSHGALPVRDLKLGEGFHYLEIWKSGKRFCSLPVEIKRGVKLVQDIPVAEIPDGYEFIPAGDFIEGDENTELANGSVGRQEMSVPGFFMQRQPVTVGDYARFVQSADFEPLMEQVLQGNHLTPSQFSEGAKSVRDLKPDEFDAGSIGVKQYCVRGVSYYEALAFARWAGARLPTEFEWEKAVRGVDGRLFATGVPFVRQKESGYSGMLKPSGPIPLTSYGCDNLLGIYLQWTSSPDQVLKGRFIVKGCTWLATPAEQKVSHRRGFDPLVKYHTISLVLAKDLPKANAGKPYGGAR